jgi:hypothetical protein
MGVRAQSRGTQRRETLIVINRLAGIIAAVCVRGWWVMMVMMMYRL